MKFYLTALSILVTIVTNAQFSDDFTDGDFVSSPSWTGMDANFEVNASNQLHLIAPAVADTSYLVVFSTIADDVTWDFWMEMDFNPSSGNNARLYLMSDQVNLKGSLNGYFIMVGNTSDEISLYRQDGLEITEILDGVDGTVNSDNVQARIRVTRSGAGVWEVFRDSTGGYSFVSEGTVTDMTHTSTSYSGVFCKYTATRSDLFYFDDIGVPYVDGVPPVVSALTVVSETELDVQFSEPVDELSASVLTNYAVNLGIGNPISASVDLVDLSVVHLSFASSFPNGVSHLITVDLVQDLAGNVMPESQTLPFMYFVPEPTESNDVIFTEIFPDPNPVIALPEVEFIEIYNRSTKVIDLGGWTLNDNTTTATFPTYILNPDSYVIICGPDEGVLFGIANFIEMDGLPTLTNADDELVLKNELEEVIDSIHYYQSWYNDPLKEDGGWTMERKHLNSPCSDQNNWGASVNGLGGTPGVQNSLWTDLDDVSAPTISSFLVLSDTEISLNFNETMDTTSSLFVSSSPSLAAVSAEFTSLNMALMTALTLMENTVYTITIAGGKDCWGNEMNETIEFGLPGSIEPGDFILNEILFDPQTGGSDYLELVNVSDKILDLNQLVLASWDDEIAHHETVGDAQRLILPGEYIVLTEDSTAVINDFSIYGIGRFLETGLPTYPNDSGTVYLLRADSVIIDYFHYDADYHYALLNSVDGKALERITFGGGMNNPDNWHTASEFVECGTPGYLNSQFADPNAVGEVNIDPKLFSPDNDGYNDVMIINFQFVGTDNIMDVLIYDNQGRLIRQLKDNYYIGQSGFLTWDGVADGGEKAAIGTYIVFVSVKDPTGVETQFKLVTVLGGQF